MADYFVGWGSLALINAALANMGGRGPLKYFLASLLFGPIVTLVLATTTRGPKGTLEQADMWNGSKK